MSPRVAQSTRKNNNGHLVPLPISAADVLARFQADLEAEGETVRFTDAGVPRYYRSLPGALNAWVRIAQPGGHGEYPLTETDRALLAF